MRTKNRRIVAASITAATLVTLTLGGAAAAQASDAGHGRGHHDHDSNPVIVRILSPHRGDTAGVAGAGWVVDLSLTYKGGLKAADFSGLQLTGPAGHNNIAPFPGTFSPGQDDRLPGLVVLSSTTTSTATGFSGPGTNLANLFNLTGVSDRSGSSATIQDDWILGAPIAGQNVTTTLTVAVVADKNKDGIYNDAPAVVPDANHDGRIDAADLKALGLASKIETVTFRINGATS